MSEATQKREAQGKTISNVRSGSNSELASCAAPGPLSRGQIDVLIAARSWNLESAGTDFKFEDRACFAGLKPVSPRRDFVSDRRDRRSALPNPCAARTRGVRHWGRGPSRHRGPFGIACPPPSLADWR